MDIIGYFMGKIGKKEKETVEQNDEIGGGSMLCEVEAQETLPTIVLPVAENRASFQKQSFSDDRHRFFYNFDGRRDYVCSVFADEKEDAVRFLEGQLMRGMDKESIVLNCRERYNLRRRKQPSTVKDSAEEDNNNGKDFSFSSKRNGRVKFNYRFDYNLEFVSWCKDTEKDQILKECRELIADGIDKEDAVLLLRGKYQKAYPRKMQSDKPNGAVLTWDDKGELLFKGNRTKITPSQMNMICTLHINHDNPFTFADYVLQNLPNASVLAVSYICTHYDEIPFSELVKEGMKIAEKGRGFKDGFEE